MSDYILLVSEPDVAEWLIDRLAELGHIDDYSIEFDKDSDKPINKFRFDESVDMDELLSIL